MSVSTTDWHHRPGSSPIQGLDVRLEGPFLFPPPPFSLLHWREEDKSLFCRGSWFQFATRAPATPSMNWFFSEGLYKRSVRERRSSSLTLFVLAIELKPVCVWAPYSHVPSEPGGSRSDKIRKTFFGLTEEWVEISSSFLESSSRLRLELPVVRPIQETRRAIARRADGASACPRMELQAGGVVFVRTVGAATPSSGMGLKYWLIGVAGGVGPHDRPCCCGSASPSGRGARSNQAWVSVSFGWPVVPTDNSEKGWECASERWTRSGRASLRVKRSEQEPAH